MDGVPLYLRSDVQVEPLFDRWYAWSHLIAPATAARNLTERHLKILDSYVAGPHVHANAVRNPKLLGGPFIDYDGKRADEIKALRDQTTRRRPRLIELSAAIASLDETLRVEAKGRSLQPLYAHVPDALRGYVELVYDLHHAPSFRIIEPLLYRRYYDRAAQSLMLSRSTGDDRPFVLSTPRLDAESLFHWEVPFESAAVDELFRLRSSPRPWDEIADLLQVPAASCPLVRSLLTEEPPPARADNGRRGGLRVRYLGHACLLVETPDVSLLFDPVVSYGHAASGARYTYADLPDSIDYVVITHNHQDHVLFETLLQIRHKVKGVVVPPGSGFLQDPSLRLILEHIGYRNVIELDELESVEWPGGSLTAVPFLGEHADLSIRCKTAYLVRAEGRSLLLAADSCNLEPKLYQHLHDALGDVDAIFLGMECDGAPLSWLYGPLFTRKLERALDDSRRLAGSNFEQAMALVRGFDCKSVFVYGMGQEPWLRYVMSLEYTESSRPIMESKRLIEECASRGIQVERLFGTKEILV